MEEVGRVVEGEEEVEEEDKEVEEQRNKGGRGGEEEESSDGGHLAAAGHGCTKSTQILWSHSHTQHRGSQRAETPAQTHTCTHAQTRSLQVVHSSLCYSFLLAVSLVCSAAHLGRSVEAVPAGVTVDASRVLLAVDADSAPTALALSIQAEREISHRLVVVAV